MKTSVFKKEFGRIPKRWGFEFNYGGWFLESKECILVLDLQKSNFGNQYYLNIKIFIQGCFSKTYCKSKELVKREVGNVSRRQPTEYNSFFDLDTPMDDLPRSEGLEKLFKEFVGPFSDKALTLFGIKHLEEEKLIFFYRFCPRKHRANRHQFMILYNEYSTH